MKNKACTSLLLSMLLMSQLGMAASITLLGTPANLVCLEAEQISGNGQSVILTCYSPSDFGGGPTWNAYRWTRGSGFFQIPRFDNNSSSFRPFAISNDGTVVVGTSGGKAVRWTQGGGVTSLLRFDGIATDTSADGNVVVGESETVLPLGQKTWFRWTLGGGAVEFESPFDANAGQGDVRESIVFSADGSTMSVPTPVNGGFEYEAALLTPSGTVVQTLGDLPGGRVESIATDLSANGQIVVGQSNGTYNNEAFRWSASGGMVGLGHLVDGSGLLNTQGFESSSAVAVSSDGSIVVGQDGWGSTGSRAVEPAPFIWTATGGMKDLFALWQAEGVVLPAGCEARQRLKIRGMSADGQTILVACRVLSTGGGGSTTTYNNFIVSMSNGGGGGIPTAPTGPNAAPGSGQVTLTWNAASGATSYNVYQGTSPNGQSPTPVATGITTTSKTVTGLTNGTTYYFKVAGVNLSGTSSLSNEVSATPIVGGSTAVANPDSVATAPGTGVTVSVLSNDTGFSSPTVTITVAPTNGTASVSPDQNIVYTPNPGFTGQDSLQYVATDGAGSASAALTITVSGPVARTLKGLFTGHVTEASDLGQASFGRDPSTWVGRLLTGTFSMSTDLAPPDQDPDPSRYSFAQFGYRTEFLQIEIVIDGKTFRTEPTVGPAADTSGDNGNLVDSPGPDADRFSLQDLYFSLQGRNLIGFDASIEYFNIASSTPEAVSFFARSSGALAGFGLIEDLYAPAGVEVRNGKIFFSLDTLNVTGGGVAVTAVDDFAQIFPDVAVPIDVLSNDAGFLGLPAISSPPQFGTATVSTDGSGTILYSPNAGYSGRDTLSYSIANGSGPTAMATLTVLVQGTDLTPVSFTFTDVVGAETATLQTSNAVTITGIDSPAPIFVLGGAYSIGCTATFTTDSGEINNNQSVCVQHLSASTPSTGTDTTLTIGTVEDTFTSTTTGGGGGGAGGGGAVDGLSLLGLGLLGWLRRKISSSLLTTDSTVGASRPPRNAVSNVSKRVGW